MVLKIPKDSLVSTEKREFLKAYVLSTVHGIGCDQVPFVHRVVTLGEQFWDEIERLTPMTSSTRTTASLLTESKVTTTDFLAHGFGI